MEFYLNNNKIKDKSITKEKLADGVIIDSEATQSEKGLLSAEDKKKLDDLSVDSSITEGTDKDTSETESIYGALKSTGII